MRPQTTVVKVMLWASALLLLAAACDRTADTDGPSPTQIPSPNGTPAVQSCTSPQQGYRVSYPDDWHVNDPEIGTACTWFHPEPFQLPQDTEATGIAIHIDVEPVGFQMASESATSGPHVEELVSQRSETAAGRTALRAEVILSGEALLPQGTRHLSWVVDWTEGQTLIASTSSAAGGDYQQNTRVLDRMMASLEAVQLEASCSAAALESDLPNQSGLPTAVAELRREIAAAAVACDFDRLAELARRGGGEFTHSFGDGDDPAAFWRRQESEPGPNPMLYLVGVLKRSYGTEDVQGSTQYVWPAAFSYDEWSEVPEEHREELRPLYTETDFSSFDNFGAYTGYRVGINSSANWLFFVSGD